MFIVYPIPNTVLLLFLIAKNGSNFDQKLLWILTQTNNKYIQIFLKENNFGIRHNPICPSGQVNSLWLIILKLIIESRGQFIFGGQIKLTNIDQLIFLRYELLAKESEICKYFMDSFNGILFPFRASFKYWGMLTDSWSVCKFANAKWS